MISRRQRGMLLRKLIESRCPHNLAALEIAIHTGVRSGEQHSMYWWQIDLDCRVLLIPKNRSKTKKGRHIQLNAIALEAFKRLRIEAEAKCSFHPDRAVFLNRYAEPLRSHRDWFDPILAEAKLLDFTWHCLRHTFASRLVMAGVDPRTVGELMGYSSSEMTKRYSHLSDSHEELAVARLERKVEQTGTTSVTSALESKS